MPDPADVAAPRFAAFDAPHLLTLALIAGLAVWVARAAPGDAARRGRLAWALAVALLLQEAVKLYFYTAVAGQPWNESLPLALCRVNEFLCVVLLVRPRYRLFEVAYFWAMAGSVSAMVTPDLAEGFPTAPFLLFFIGHGLVVLAVIYAVFGFGYWPRARSVVFALAVTAGYALIIAPVNLLLDANYLFLRARPAATAALDVFGPWPYYLLALFGLAIVACWLAYLPFAVARWLGHRPPERQPAR